MLKKLNLFLFLLLLANSFMFSQTKQLQAVKKESFITYKLTHPLHEIESTSRDVFCLVNVDEKVRQISSVAVQVDVTSFDSGNSNRDSHAMEVVEAITYPDARFISSSVTQKGDNLQIWGKLTFHGVTKDVLIHAVASWTDKQLIVNGGFDISLTEFHIQRPSLLLIPVNDDLKFTLKQVFNL